MSQDSASPLLTTACRGVQSGCPRAAAPDGPLLLQALDGSTALARLRLTAAHRLGARPPRHHAFSVSVSACPNGCSRPHIADVGLTGAVRPRLTDAPCLQCGACLAACREDALALDAAGPRVDRERCLECGDCLRACPSGTLAAGETGWRVWLGGRLGRRPALADPLPGRRSSAQVVEILTASLALWLDGLEPGRRFRDILTEARLADSLPAVLQGAETVPGLRQAVPAMEPRP